MNPDAPAAAAARNNADLYVAMFDSWGLGHRRTAYAFIALDQPPPYYSHLTVLSPGRGAQIMAQLDALTARFGGGVGVKDSFCELDLGERGFRLLSEASWIRRPAGAEPAVHDWRKVDDPDALERWEEAWKACGSPCGERMFRPSLLQRPDVAFLGKRTADGAFEAGCIANLSTDCIGLSNLFSRGGGCIEEATAAVAAIGPDLPIVGYASGPLLKTACQAGYEAVGGLRIFAQIA